MPYTNSDYHRFNLHRLTGALEVSEEKESPKELTANGGSIAPNELPTDEFQKVIPKDFKAQENVSIFGVCISCNILNELTIIRDPILQVRRMSLRYW